MSAGKAGADICAPRSLRPQSTQPSQPGLGRSVRFREADRTTQVPEMAKCRHHLAESKRAAGESAARRTGLEQMAGEREH
jgi:hypothetical protein